MNCVDWMENFLTGKDIVLCEVVRVEAKRQGFSKKQLKEARKILQVETVNDWAANGETLNWFWRLPEEVRHERARH